MNVLNDPDWPVSKRHWNLISVKMLTRKLQSPPNKALKAEPVNESSAQYQLTFGRAFQEIKVFYEYNKSCWIDLRNGEWEQKNGPLTKKDKKRLYQAIVNVTYTIGRLAEHRFVTRNDLTPIKIAPRIFCPISSLPEEVSLIFMERQNQAGTRARLIVDQYEQQFEVCWDDRQVVEITPLSEQPLTEKQKEDITEFTYKYFYEPD